MMQWLLFLRVAGFLLVSLVCFYGMALVADRFVVILCELSERLRLPKNVAGATLMAAGASSPELFSNIVSVYITKSDLGFGTIVGSEVFNHLVIVGGVAWCRDGPQRLDPATCVRDTGAYLLSLGLLLLAVSDVNRRNSDGAVVVIRFVTTAPLVAGYAAYVFLCSEVGRGLLTRWVGPGPVKDEEEAEPLLPCNEESNQEDQKSLANAVVRWTLPSSAPYLGSLVAVVWMSALAYVMVVVLERVARDCGVSTAIVGITVSAVGTSWPNYVSSTAAARRGEANMAVSNALGSNVFNLCIALGLPWLVYPLVYRGHNYTRMPDEDVDLLVFFLMALLLLYCVILAITNCTLYPHFSFYFGALYLAFLAVAIFARPPLDSIENREQGGH